MKILIFKDFMKKYKLKNDTMNESQLQNFVIIIYIPEILKYIQIKYSLILVMEAWEEATGLVL